MAQWGSTTFTEFIGDHSPSEQFSQEISRAVRKLDIIPGTLAARQQAVADFLGYAQVVTAGGKFRYISRGTPLPYSYVRTNPSGLPASQYLYATNITQGEAVGSPTNPTQQGLDGGPANQAGGVGVGSNFSRYRYTVEFCSRSFDTKPDAKVLAIEGGDPEFDFLVSPPKRTRPSGAYPVSPLYDDVNKVGYPDEGQMLAGISFWGDIQGMVVRNWPPPGAAWPFGKPTFSTASRYVTRFFRPAGRMRVLPFGMLHWYSDDMIIREGFPWIESTGTLQYQWHEVPETGIPLYAIQTSINCVNDDWFDGFPAQTLLFKSADLRRYVNPLGVVQYTVEYNFSYLPNTSKDTNDPNGLGYPYGWNCQLRAKGKPQVLQYEAVVDDNLNQNPRNPYDDAPFDALFRPDQP